MAMETEDVMESHTPERNELIAPQMEFHTELMALRTVSMMPWMPLMSPETTAAMTAMTAVRTAWITGQTAFHTVWMTASAAPMACCMPVITVVTTDWMRGMFALTQVRMSVSMGMTTAIIWVATLMTVACMAAIIGAAPASAAAICATRGSSSGPTVETRFPSAPVTGWKAGASVPVMKSASCWNAAMTCEESTVGSCKPTDESA